MKPQTETDTLSPVAEETVANPSVGIDQSAGNFSYDVAYEFDAGSGLNERTIDYISSVKKEAPWIRDFRHKALQPRVLALDDLPSYRRRDVHYRSPAHAIHRHCRLARQLLEVRVRRLSGGKRVGRTVGFWIDEFR